MSKVSEAVIACGLPHLGRGALAQFRNEFTAVQDPQGAVFAPSPPGRGVVLNVATVSQPAGVKSRLISRARRSRSKAHERGRRCAAVCSNLNLSAHATIGRNTSWS